MSKTMLAAAAVLLASKLSAQSYQISLRLDGLDTGFVTLGYFFGKEQYAVDSARFDAATRTVTFRGEEPLAQGMYFAGQRTKKLLDFMVDSFQVFTLKGRLSAPDSMEVEGNSDENRAFFAHKMAIAPLLTQLEQAASTYELLTRATKDPADLKEPRERVNSLYRQVNTATEQHIAANPGRLYTKMLLMGFSPNPPADLPAKKDGRINPEYLDWLRDHYFDNVDWADSRLLYCNVFADRVEGFLHSYWPQTDKGSIDGCDFILSKTKDWPDFNIWTIVNLIRMFESSEWGPGATVFVHLVDKYQQPGQHAWLDDATQMRLQFKADVNRTTLIGKTAPPLDAYDPDGKLFVLDSLDAPVTMLVFYSPLCDHCKADLPYIFKAFIGFKEKGLKAVAVSTNEAGRDEWLQFIKKKGYDWTNLIEPKEPTRAERDLSAFPLPIIYLLDRDKKILARRVKASELEAVLTNIFKDTK